MKKRDVIYGITFTPERMFSYDLNTRTARDLGPISSGFEFTQGQNIELDDEGCAWSAWSVSRAWQNEPGPDSKRLCKYDPLAGSIVHFKTGLPKPGSPCEYVHLDGLFNLKSGGMFATGGNGYLYRIDTESGKAEYLGAPVEGRPSRLSSMKLGRDGAGLWSGRHAGQLQPGALRSEDLRLPGAGPGGRRRDEVLADPRPCDHRRRNHIRLRKRQSVPQQLSMGDRAMTIDGYCTLGVDREFDLTAKALLDAMDAAEVERAMIAPPDRALAIFNRQGNDCMRQAAQAHPDRFIATCSVNPWSGEEALQELRRAIGEGARMLVLHPLVQGYTANDELVFPVLELAAAERIPVYVHTGPPGNSTPWQIVDLAEQYSSLDIIMGHCGATDFWNDVPDSAASAANIYLESSLARPFHFARYMDSVGKHKGIIGSWAPLNKLGFEWDQMRKFLRPEVFAETSGNNLARLLAKRGSL